MTLTVYRCPTDPARAVQVALAAVGRCACKPYRQAFLEALLPPPKGEQWPLSVPFRQWTEGGRTKTQGVSTCGVFALRCWYPDEVEPYKIGSAFARIQRAQRIAVPEPGAIILSPVHAMLCVEHVPEYGYVETVEGGQTCPHVAGDGHEGRGLQAIRRKTHVWPG